MKYFLILTLIALVGCTETEKPETKNGTDPKSEAKDPFEGLSMTEAIELHIRRELSISADESLDYQVYKEDCDGDDFEDVVITVNLLDRAVDQAIKSGQVAKAASIGYMGNYNFLIYRDGFSGKFTSAMVIASSPKTKLKVQFTSVISEKQKDILIDYRVLNAAFRNYFTLTNGHPLLVNQVKLFDKMGTKDAVAFAVEYEPGSISSSKDIKLYKGTFSNPTFAQLDDVYSFEPTIAKTSKIIK